MREQDDAAPGVQSRRTAAPARRMLDRVEGLLRRRLWRHPIYVWVLWFGAALVLAACPMMLSDPAMWPYLLDPELLALVVIIGAQFTTLQIQLLRARVTAGRRR